jgi:hypothetical protein
MISLLVAHCLRSACFVLEPQPSLLAATIACMALYNFDLNYNVSPFLL